MREAYDTATTRARIFINTRYGSCSKAGGITQPLLSGLVTESNILTGPFALCRDECDRDKSNKEITLSKSVGTAIEGLAAA